ncbi:MAG: hypothetical protein H7095_05545 [Pseudopedobacter sp.]|nr:hypothetical protein [Deinococcales bacterium]
MLEFSSELGIAPLRQLENSLFWRNLNRENSKQKEAAPTPARGVKYGFTL